MAKAATEKATKSATKRASAKTDADAKEKKEKRAPTKYNIFVKENLKPWIDANPGKTHKEAMSHIASLWRESSDNPNKGKEPKKRAPKKAKKADASSDVEETPVPSSDA